MIERGKLIVNESPFTKEEGDALLWLIDFELENPHQPLAGSCWPPKLRGAEKKLKAMGHKNPYQTDLLGAMKILKKYPIG